MKEKARIEKRRKEILMQMESIKSMIRGSITEQMLKVKHKGKQEPQLKGPYYVLSANKGGKTESRRLTSPEEIELVRREIENHKLFRGLCKEYEELTERLGEIMRDDVENSPEKKTLEVEIEKDSEVKRFIERALSERGADLESWEMGLRSAVLAAGARLLEKMLDGIGRGRGEEPCRCPRCRGLMKSKGVKAKRIKTVLGDIVYNRSLFICEECGASFFPGDEALDVVGTMFSPGTRRLMSRAGQRDTFKEGRDDLREFAEIQVTAKDVERVSEQTGREIETWQRSERPALIEGRVDFDDSEPIAVLYISYDGTGIPSVPWELEGRKGKQPDGRSKTREAKLGCVFTQTTVNEEGYAVRDDASTTFVGAIETSADFGDRIYCEAVRRGLNRALKTVVLADGAKYNWEIAALHFHGCVEIVDLYHAREHLHDLCVLFVPGGGRELTNLETRWRTMLDENKVDKIIAQAESKLGTVKNDRAKEDIKKQIGYFRNNAHRMRYGEFRDQGLFVGSGVVEAGCKTVIGKRLKQSGMEWTEEGANSIIGLRCCYMSGRIEEYWEQRA